MGAGQSVGEDIIAKVVAEYPAEEVSGPEEYRSTFLGQTDVTKLDKDVKKFTWSMGAGTVLLKKVETVEVSKVGDSSICVAELTGILKIWGTGKCNVGIKKGNVLYFHSMVESRSVIDEAKVTILEECMNSEFAIKAGKVIVISSAKSNLNIHKAAPVELQVWDPDDKKLLDGAAAEAKLKAMGGNLLVLNPEDMPAASAPPAGKDAPPLPSTPAVGAGPDLSAVQALNHNMNFQLGIGLGVGLGVGVGMGGYGQ